MFTTTADDGQEVTSDWLDPTKAFAKLLEMRNKCLAAGDGEKKSDRMAPVFSVEGRNGTLSGRACGQATQFFQQYGFVCLATDEDETFAKHCAQLRSVDRADRPAGHEAYAFLHQQRRDLQSILQPNGSYSSLSTTSNVESRQVLESDIHDFYPDAVCHSQAAWDIRCSAKLRRFCAGLFEQGHGEQTLVDMCKADQLLPSIEPVLRVGGNNLHGDATDENIIGRRPSKCTLTLPTFHVNPAWTRAPQVIGAYHLHAYNNTLQKHWQEYVRDTASGQENCDRVQQRWLTRLRKEFVATARKIVLGKRATNKMVQDAAFHSKKASVPDREAVKKTNQAKQQPSLSDSAAKQPVEAVRPLQAGYEALVCVGSATVSTATKDDGKKYGENAAPIVGYINVVPSFVDYYPHFFAYKRSKWAQASGDCVTASMEDDDFTRCLFESCSIAVPLRAGQTLILDRRMPRWISQDLSANKSDMLLLPVAYRHQQMTLAGSQQKQPGNLLLQAARFAQLCPVELALHATYQQSILHGIVYTSLPHLTGSVHFARSTKKTALDLKHKRAAAYNAWKAAVGENSFDRKHLYSPPKLPAFLCRLLCGESAQIAHLDGETERLTRAVSSSNDRKSGFGGKKRKRLSASSGRKSRQRIGAGNGYIEREMPTLSTAQRDKAGFDSLDALTTTIDCGSQQQRNDLQQFLYHGGPSFSESLSATTPQTPPDQMDNMFDSDFALPPPPLFCKDFADEQVWTGSD